MKYSVPKRISSITEFHRMRGLPKPRHPLISLADYSQMVYGELDRSGLLFDFYTISVKKNVEGKFRYGQMQYDFDEGIMFFTAPNQLFIYEAENIPKISGWLLLIHPDFLWNTDLANKMDRYDFFDYAVNEALFLSEKEEELVNDIVKNIRNEYNGLIDVFSKSIISSHIENLLSYAERFYHRQFLTREKINHQVLDRFESLLAQYFKDVDLISRGLPSVQYVSEQLNISPTYLLSLLKALTGQTTQQLIHSKLIEKAKEKLSTTDLAVSQVAYELGFEHPQSFSKLFKQKTNLSPLAFRAKFN